MSVQNRSTETSAIDALAPGRNDDCLGVWTGPPPGLLAADEPLHATFSAEMTRGSFSMAKSRAWRDPEAIPYLKVFRPPAVGRSDAAVLMIPGGAYSWVAFDGEAVPLAPWLSARGITVFVLIYRCRHYTHPVPFHDAQRAMRVIRARAADFGLRSDRIGVMGLSAGGHVAATLCVHHTRNFKRHAIDRVDGLSPRPDFAALVYPVISMRPEWAEPGSRANLLGTHRDDTALWELLSADEHVGSDTPPTFLAHSACDPVVKAANSKRYFDALTAQGVANCQLHLLETGSHGIGMHPESGCPTILESREDFLERLVDWLSFDLGVLDAGKAGIAAPARPRARQPGGEKTERP